MDKGIHEIQAEILRILIYKEEARFSDLSTKKLSSDQLTFHVKQLLNTGIIEKTEEGLYRLTVQGKNYANRFDVDTSTVKIEQQGKLSVLVVATRQHNDSLEYLMQERLKHPFYGYRGFITGKIKIGETALESAQRELEEETGLRGNFEHKAIVHERIYAEVGEFLEDKYFFIYLVKNTNGELVHSFEGGNNHWINESDVLRGNIFYEIGDILAAAKLDKFSYFEKKYTVERY